MNHFPPSDLELSQKLQVASHPEKSQRQLDLEAMLPGICRELKRKGVTREQLYKEYIQKYPEGYSISRFCGFIRLYSAQSRPVMHIEHKAGDKMYIDFTGQKLQLNNPDGIKSEVEVFVAILGSSQLTYVEAVEIQKKEDLIRACENSLIYFEGSQMGYKVLYASTSKLMGQLKLAKAKGTNLAELKRIERVDLLILDDFGLQPFDSQARVTLLDIIEDRHGKKSTLITSQIPVQGMV